MQWTLSWNQTSMTMNSPAAANSSIGQLWARSLALRQKLMPRCQRLMDQTANVITLKLAASAGRMNTQTRRMW